MSSKAFPSLAMTAVCVRRLLDKPRVSLGRWPTPIEQHKFGLHGKVLVKRDDLAGFGGERRSGVKARKLEAFLAYLRDMDVEKLIMPLGNITNLGRDLVQVVSQIGLDLHLLIGDDPPLPLEVRRSLFQGLENQVRLLGSNRLRILGELIVTWLRARVSGQRAFAVLPSPGHPTAVLGMAWGYLEMVEQVVQLTGRLPRAVYIAAAAGSSAAGLALAEALMRTSGSPPVKIVAVQVTAYPLWVLLPVLLKWTKNFLKLRQPLDFSTLSIVADNRHITYGRFDAQHLAVCERLETEYGLLVDPIYGAKTWSAMEELEPSTDETLGLPLFWHCGYTPHWRTYNTPQSA